MLTRRRLLEGATAGAVLAGIDRSALKSASAETLDLPPALPRGVLANASLESLPGKKPLIKLTYRPPNYETPIDYFRSVITPNDAFFVRYHLSDIPEVDPKSWKLTIGGEGVERQTELTLDDLRNMPSTEVVAINQCAGNRRALFDPHVPGVQWGNGAMGCARWKGARLKDLLDKAGLRDEVIEIAFNGADAAPFDKTPNFVKSLPLWRALDENTLVAYEMNGAPLPHFNGFPVRLVVPGWAGAYWIKHLTGVRALNAPEKNYWMSAAYRVPVGKFPMVARFISQETATNTPITEIMVNSLITSPADGATVKPGNTVSGLAWDGGYGISTVEVSTDGGKTWRNAVLGEDLGRFAFRPFNFTLRDKGKATVMARATNAIGQTQTANLIQNPAGYHDNVMQSLSLTVA